MSVTRIKNGIIIDGSGDPGYRADLLIRDDRIWKITDGLNADEMEKEYPVALVIDAAGKVVTPGFIDIHRHHDARILTDSSFGQTEVCQGITTAVSGNCGISITPRPVDDTAAREYYTFQEPVMGPIDTDGPVSYGDFISLLESRKQPINTMAMIGTGAVRVCTKGFSDASFTKEELEKARFLVEDAMEKGAPGISLGIMYIPECFTSAEEFASILEPVGRYGRVITTHIRGEGDQLVDSIREVVQIAKMAGCSLEISHFKSCGLKNWRKDIYRAIDVIEEARKEGIDVTCDYYPYDGGSTSLSTMLPPVLLQDGMNETIARLGTSEGVDAFRQAVRKTYTDWDNYAVSLGWDRVLISGTAQEENRKFVGLTVAEGAQKYGFSDPEEFAAYLLHSDNAKTAIIIMSMCQEDIDVIAALPYSMIISDAIYARTDTPHPRMHGAFPKVIREYVKERKIYTLEKAVRKMSALPARRMGIGKRGILSPGYYADVLVFDPDQFRDNATYENPAALASGLDWCLINGKAAVCSGKLTGERPGCFIKAGSAEDR